LRGRYLEHVGFWMPRHQATYRRQVVINKHKVRYWLGVGAQPTKRVAAILHKYGFWPKPPTPHGSRSVYEKPKKVLTAKHMKDHFRGIRDPEGHFENLIRSQINIMQRNRLLQQEAVDKLGQEVDMELMKTDDLESEEADIFKRVDKFKELKKRLEKHREENQFLRGNDLRYNVYLKKMQKLVRMDLGLDLDAFKDFVNNSKSFAKHHSEWEIFGKDDLKIPAGVIPGHEDKQVALDPVSLEAAKQQAVWEQRTFRVQNTVLKLLRNNKSQLSEKDFAVIEEFASESEEFLERDGNLAIDVKMLYEKRKAELERRAQEGVHNISALAEEEVLAKGVSKRELDLIMKFLELDPEFFSVKQHLAGRQLAYTVDLSRFDDKKIPQDCKAVLYNPKKMQLLTERYWALATETETQQRDITIDKSKRRFTPHRMAKGEDEYRLMDRIIEIVDRLVAKQKLEQSAGDALSPAEKFAAAIEEHKQTVEGTRAETGFRRLFHSSSF
jgi:ribosomal protein S16